MVRKMARFTQHLQRQVEPAYSLKGEAFIIHRVPDAY
jgi:hypothetical protein